MYLDFPGSMCIITPNANCTLCILRSWYMFAAILPSHKMGVETHHMAFLGSLPWLTTPKVNPLALFYNMCGWVGIYCKLEVDGLPSMILLLIFSFSK